MFCFVFGFEVLFCFLVMVINFYFRTKHRILHILYLPQLLHSCLNEDSKFFTMGHGDHGFSLKKYHSICCQLRTRHLKNLVSAKPHSRHAAAAAAKSLQSCPTLCDPIDGSPLGSPVPGILQARTLEWVAISFSNA